MSGPVERGPASMVLGLGFCGLVSGVAIVSVFELTLPRIEENRARALREAVFEVVPGSTAFQKLVLKGGALAVADESPGAAAAAAPGIYAAFSADGRFAGYAIPGEGAGFQDTIRLIFGFEPKARHIVGMRVLESRETPGLGDKIFKDAAFARNFEALAVEPEIVVVKHGTKTAPNQVDGITGATISSRAVARILGDTLTEWTARLPAPGKEPSLRASKAGGG